MFYYSYTKEILVHNYLFIHAVDKSKLDWYKRKGYSEIDLNNLDKDLNNSGFIEYSEVFIEYPKRSFKRFNFNQNSN